VVGGVPSQRAVAHATSVDPTASGIVTKRRAHIGLAGMLPIDAEVFLQWRPSLRRSPEVYRNTIRLLMRHSQ
jgi:hypothetical protein